MDTALERRDTDPLLVGATRLGLGAAAFVYGELQKAVAPDRAARAFGPGAHVAIGALVGAEELALSVTSRVSGVVTRPASTLARTRVAAPIVGLVRRFEDRGRREADYANAESALALDAVLARAAQSALILKMVFGVVDEVIWPIVDEVLPGVMDRLNADPAPIQSLMMGQSTGIAVEFTDAARTGAARADDRVSAIVDRVLRRTRPATID